jgi:ankyrin repeat protein
MLAALESVTDPEGQGLLKAGALIDERDATGNTALHFACANGCSETVELLLSHGALIHDMNEVR